jgi:hypothetical protein
MVYLAWHEEATIAEMMIYYTTMSEESPPYTQSIDSLQVITSPPQALLGTRTHPPFEWL